MKEQSKTSERELSYEEIANLSDGEFKALVIKMLTELTELGRKMKKQMKDTQNETAKYSGNQQWQEGNQELKKKSTRIIRLVRQLATRAGWEKLRQGSGLGRWGWLKRKQIQSWQWTMAVAVVGETPSLTQESLLENELETIRRVVLFPLWHLPHKQWRSTTKRVALPKWIAKASSPTTSQVCWGKEIGPKWKNNLKKRAKPWGDSQPIWWRI